MSANWKEELFKDQRTGWKLEAFWFKSIDLYQANPGRELSISPKQKKTRSVPNILNRTKIARICIANRAIIIRTATTQIETARSLNKMGWLITFAHPDQVSSARMAVHAWEQLYVYSNCEQILIFFLSWWHLLCALVPFQPREGDNVFARADGLNCVKKTSSGGKMLKKTLSPSWGRYTPCKTHNRYETLHACTTLPGECGTKVLVLTRSLSLAAFSFLSCGGRGT